MHTSISAILPLPCQPLTWDGPLTPAILAALPATVGSYALDLRLDQALSLLVGRLGVCEFPAGGYFYLGSAYGVGGLRARLGHHARTVLRPHWHIDYLRPLALLVGGWAVQADPVESGRDCTPTGFWPQPGASATPLPLECAWSRALLRLPGARPAVPGFGSSDCRSGCPAHLVYLPYV